MLHRTLPIGGYLEVGELYEPHKKPQQPSPRDATPTHQPISGSIETNDVVDNLHRWCGSCFTAPYLSAVILGLVSFTNHIKNLNNHRHGTRPPHTSAHFA
nr:hypothetical protein [uncultured Amphritea sp.]